MNKQRPILILALLFYIVAPTLFNWMSNAQGPWYRPFIVWMIIIIIAFFVQNRDKADDL